MLKYIWPNKRSHANNKRAQILKLTFPPSTASTACLLANAEMHLENKQTTVYLLLFFLSKIGKEWNWKRFVPCTLLGVCAFVVVYLRNSLRYGIWKMLLKYFSTRLHESQVNKQAAMASCAFPKYLKNISKYPPWWKNVFLVTKWKIILEMWYNTCWPCILRACT